MTVADEKRDGCACSVEDCGMGHTADCPVAQKTQRDKLAQARAALEAAGYVVEPPEVEFVRCGEDGWKRIGRFDSAGRRSLWMRIEGAYEGDGDVEAIELCSGREGDDGYVKFTPAYPQWAEICNTLLRPYNDCAAPSTAREWQGGGS